MAPPTFASAAAGNNSHTPSSRDAGSEWARRTNGATQTFRRPSATASTASVNPPSETATAASQPAPRYVPPHRNGTSSDTMRYTKEQLLDLGRSLRDAEGGLADGLPSLYTGGWQPDLVNGASTAGWGRGEHGRDGQSGPDVCWVKDGNMEPLGLREMDDEEELFSTSVNTPLKPPTTSNKDNQQTNGLSGRKISVSGTAATPGGIGLPSPSVTRGFGRRRETSESYPFPSSNPLGSPTTVRDDQRAQSPPPSLQRRRTDLQNASKSDDRAGDGDDKTGVAPVGTLRRNPTLPLSAGLGGSSSPWSNAPPSAGFSPMGSFGNFGLGGQQSGSGEKRLNLGNGRTESRFKNLLNKDSNEELNSPSVQRKTSMSSLSRVNENESWSAQEPGTAPLPENEVELLSGSAVLAAESELSPARARPGIRGFGTPSRSATQDEHGFGAFGMTADGGPGFGGSQSFLSSRDVFHQQTPSAQRTMGNEPMSPTDTNPYRSPEQHGVDNLIPDEVETDNSDMHNAHLPGLGGFGGNEQLQQLGLGSLGGLPNLGRAPGAQGAASDRSQNSSVNGNRGFPVLGGLGQLGVSGAAAWPVSQPGTFGTPGRQTSGLPGAFGSTLFSTSMAEMQSPGLAGLGGHGSFSPQGGVGFGGSKMASMFPLAMQEQMRQSDERETSGERAAQQAFGGLGGSHTPFGNQGLEEQHKEQPAQFVRAGQQSQQPVDQSVQQDEQASGQQPPNSASNQPPPPQQRTMVMPDRMRWIYRDPQGQTQGPWSGLEMHDWYKAGFFSPELLVKKVEDPEYEPLAQLIRRIGNSREPFLVPQIGIPHGAPTNTGQGPNAWAGSAGGSSNGGAQPPFASSFPSFGTTLTAEQQNALERRKQEEQYLMARQKEHLVQAQMAQRMHLSMAGGPGNHHPGLVPALAPGQLHHHGSAQSLHSQPSFGSMTSPNAFQPSPIQGPVGGTPGHVPGFFDNSFRVQQAGGLGAVGAGIESLGHIREEEIQGIMNRLSLGNRTTGATQFGAPGQPFAPQQPLTDEHEKKVQQMLQDRAGLQQEQAQHDARDGAYGTDLPLSNERLNQFQQFQAQASGSGLETRFQAALNKSIAPTGEQPGQLSSTQNSVSSPAATQQTQSTGSQEPLSLTEQVEKAVSAQQSPVPQQPGLPHPFPPAPSQSPLPAPAAQRTGRKSVADQLQHESRDRSQTPSVETPSAAIAPWAKEPTEAPKGPSLKEIQEAEAKKAAEAEAAAAAARRAALEKEMEAQAAAAVTQSAGGLPAGASWASGSPAAQTNAAPAAWAKTAQKPIGAPAKTMAQIQKEEEARKKRLAAAVATSQGHAMSSVANPAGGKSYAHLAGKVTPTSPNVNPPTNSSGAWTTVGASGKAKTPAPAPVTVAPSAAARTANVPNAMPSQQQQQQASRKVPSNRALITNAAPSGAVNAQEEFKKWAVGELRPDLNKNIIAEEFVATLCILGTDVPVLVEAVHSASHTIDSRHFVEEFLRRKRLADKGLLDTTSSTAPKSASPANSAGAGGVGGHGVGGNNNPGGWNEVAKKGKQEVGDGSGAAFRVVSKKKGGKR
ncbi:hypothetical protein M433DRAFT_5076 [Acidomyces richmondensis BFW]|nr:hypothetical protein M433DRAFT_5076 [Acidomyces richmondensis BFW]